MLWCCWGRDGGGGAAAAQLDPDGGIADQAQPYLR